MWENFSDFDFLVEATYGYFSEYGTPEGEEASFRALTKIEPAPKGVTTLREWYQHILNNAAYNKKA